MDIIQKYSGGSKKCLDSKPLSENLALFEMCLQNFLDFQKKQRGGSCNLHAKAIFVLRLRIQKCYEMLLNAINFRLERNQTRENKWMNEVISWRQSLKYYKIKILVKC